MAYCAEWAYRIVNSPDCETAANFCQIVLEPDTRKHCLLPGIAFISLSVVRPFWNVEKLSMSVRGPPNSARKSKTFMDDEQRRICGEPELIVKTARMVWRASVPLRQT
jgi:hypothetical protein